MTCQQLANCKKIKKQLVLSTTISWWKLYNMCSYTHYGVGALHCVSDSRWCRWCDWCHSRQKATTRDALVQKSMILNGHFVALFMVGSVSMDISAQHNNKSRVQGTTYQAWRRCRPRSSSAKTLMASWLLRKSAMTRVPGSRAALTGIRVHGII